MIDRTVQLRNRFQHKIRITEKTNLFPPQNVLLIKPPAHQNCSCENFTCCGDNWNRRGINSNCCVAIDVVTTTIMFSVAKLTKCFVEATKSFLRVLIIYIKETFLHADYARYSDRQSNDTFGFRIATSSNKISQ